MPSVVGAQGFVNGTVTRAANGSGLGGGSVTFCSTTQSQCVEAFTSASGAYSVTLAPGSYVAFTRFVGQNLVNEIFDDVKCAARCDSRTALEVGALIVVVGGGKLTRNFALSAGGAISGVVTDAVSGAPLAGVGVGVFIKSNVRNSFDSAGSAVTDAAGAYSIVALPSGVYHAVTFRTDDAPPTASPQGHTNEVFDNLLCPGCSLGGATDIGVTLGVVTAGVNFALAPGGRITGRVRRADTLAPMPDVSILVVALVGQTVLIVDFAQTDASGDYAVAGLPTGTYFLVAGADDVVSELYDNQPCDAPCFAPPLHTATPVAVTQGTTTTGRDFLLDAGGSLSGKVLRAGTAAAEQARVGIYRRVGGSAHVVRNVPTDSAGNYVARGLRAGSYYAVAVPSSAGLLTEVFNGAPCSPCGEAQILAGQAIPVASTGVTPNVNFSVDPASTISGTITDAVAAAPLAGARVRLYRSGLDTPVETRTTGSDGKFSMEQLLPGMYFVTASADQYAGEVFNNRVCASDCSLAEIFAGNAFGASAGVTVININFALDCRPTAPGAPEGLSAEPSAGGVTFTWRAPTSGGKATSFVLEAGLSPGSTVVTLASATTSLTVPAVPPGTFFVRVRGVNAVGVGSPSTEYTLTVTAGGIVPDSPAELVASTSAARLTVTWSAPDRGPVDGYVLEVGSATGLSNLAVINLTTRLFVFDPVPSGFFFFRVRTRAGANLSAPSNEMMVNPGGGAAPPDPPQSFAASVNARTVGFNWDPPIVGSAANYLVEAGTAPGLSNIARFNTGNAGTTLVVPGVPPGTYYVRLRAVNSLGASPVSNEVVVVVSP